MPNESQHTELTRPRPPKKPKYPYEEGVSDRPYFIHCVVSGVQPHKLLAKKVMYEPLGDTLPTRSGISDSCSLQSG